MKWTLAIMVGNVLMVLINSFAHVTHFSPDLDVREVRNKFEIFAFIYLLFYVRIQVNMFLDFYQVVF